MSANAFQPNMSPPAEQRRRLTALRTARPGTKLGMRHCDRLTLQELPKECDDQQGVSRIPVPVRQLELRRHTLPDRRANATTPSRATELSDVSGVTVRRRATCKKGFVLVAKPAMAAACCRASTRSFSRAQSRC